MDLARTVIVAALAVALIQTAARTSYDAGGLKIAAVTDVARA